MQGIMARMQVLIVVIIMTLNCKDFKMQRIKARGTIISLNCCSSNLPEVLKLICSIVEEK